MTEVPDYLLERSRARRAALGLGGEGEAAPARGAESADATPAPAGAGTPAVAAAAAPPAVEEAPPPPPAPHVQSAIDRKRIPVWAIPVLVLLPFWAVIYAGTLSETGSGGPSQLDHGGEIYAESCAGCHGATGGGASGPPLADGAVTTTFANRADQLLWVALGSSGWPEGTYGDGAKTVEGGMPGFGASLSPEDLLAVVRYEREVLSGEDPLESEGATLGEEEELLIGDQDAAEYYFGEGAHDGTYELGPGDLPVVTDSALTGSTE